MIPASCEGLVVLCTEDFDSSFKTQLPWPFPRKGLLDTSLGRVSFFFLEAPNNILPTCLYHSYFHVCLSMQSPEFWEDRHYVGPISALPAPSLVSTGSWWSMDALNEREVCKKGHQQERRGEWRHGPSLGGKAMGLVPWPGDGVQPSPPFSNRRGPPVPTSLMPTGPHFLLH